MDFDISVPDGVFEHQKPFYDYTFIPNIFDGDNLKAIKKVSSYTNFVTGIDDFTLKEAIKNMDLTGIAMCILNELFMDRKSDGMVSIDSQRAIDRVMDVDTVKLESSHHSVVSIPRIMDKILLVIDDNISETVDKRKKRIK